MFTWEVLTCKKSKTYEFKTYMFFVFTHKSLTCMILFVSNKNMNKVNKMKKYVVICYNLILIIS